MQDIQEKKTEQLNRLIQTVFDRIILEINNKYISKKEHKALYERVIRLEQENHLLRTELKISNKLQTVSDSPTSLYRFSSKEIIYKAIDDFGESRGLTTKEIEKFTGLLGSSIKSGLRSLKWAGIVDSELCGQEYYRSCKRYYIISKRQNESSTS